MHFRASPHESSSEGLGPWEIQAVTRAVDAFLRTKHVPGCDRDDLVQECLTRWWLTRRTYRAEGGASARTFLKRVVQATLLDLLRASTAQKRGAGRVIQSLDAPLDTEEGDAGTLHEMVSDPDERVQPADAVEGLLLNEAIGQARQALGTDDQTLLDVWLAGHNPTEIGRLLDSPRTTVHARLKALFRRLQSDELRELL